MYGLALQVGCLQYYIDFAPLKCTVQCRSHTGHQQGRVIDRVQNSYQQVNVAALLLVIQS